MSASMPPDLPANPAPRRATVLVADDTPECLDALGELLAPYYAVRVAPDGPRALALALEAPAPDLVLLDVMMPGLDGHDVLRALRADPRTRDVPVIFITGLDSTESEQAGLDLGAADYIAKPFCPPVVLARVQSHIALKRARDRLTEQNAALAAEIEQRKRVESEVRRLNAALQERGEALERSVGDLQAFSYSVSHDLRAPLRAVSGFARMLAETEGGRLSPEGRHLVDRVLSGAHTMEELIAGILAYSRADRASLVRSAVDLAAVAASVTEELAGTYPSARVTIGALPVVRADSTMVRQILANLVGNALKFSGGRPDAHVEVGFTDAGGVPECFVRDNGAGFDPRYAHKLFGLFHRLHTANEFAGTGAGLAIVKRLVERHGGHVRAESEPGVSTTFAFTLEPGPGADAPAPVAVAAAGG